MKPSLSIHDILSVHAGHEFFPRNNRRDAFWVLTIVAVDEKDNQMELKLFSDQKLEILEIKE